MYHMHTLDASKCMHVVHSVGFAIAVGFGWFDLSEVPSSSWSRASRTWNRWGVGRFGIVGKPTRKVPGWGGHACAQLIGSAWVSHSPSLALNTHCSASTWQVATYTCNMFQSRYSQQFIFKLMHTNMRGKKLIVSKTGVSSSPRS